MAEWWLRKGGWWVKSVGRASLCGGSVSARLYIQYSTVEYRYGHGPRRLLALSLQEHAASFFFLSQPPLFFFSDEAPYYPSRNITNINRDIYITHMNPPHTQTFFMILPCRDKLACRHAKSRSGWIKLDSVLCREVDQKRWQESTRSHLKHHYI